MLHLKTKGEIRVLEKNYKTSASIDTRDRTQENNPKIESQDLRHSSVVKNIYCSCREPESDVQHP